MYNLNTGASLGKAVLRACPADVAWNPKRALIAMPGGTERDSSGTEQGLVDLRWIPTNHG